MSSILECPHFNEIMFWDGTERVVLEKPQILESYILKPVFGINTLDVFKRKLYVRIPYDRLRQRLTHRPHHRRYMVSTLPPTTTPIQRQLHGVLVLPCIRITLQLTIHGQNTID